MEFFRIKHDIPFMSYGKLTTVISLVTFIVAVAAIAIRGLNLGVDFTGGAVMEVSYAQPVNVDVIRDTLAKEGMDASVQHIGTTRDVLIRLPVGQVSSDKISAQVFHVLKQQGPSAELKRVEFVGPQVGQELYENGGLALLLVAAGIIVYLSIRFEWRLAVAAAIANMHDVVIVIGMFALFQWEFDLTVLAAVLAVLGYSVNESVVVFDRVRENFRKMRKASVSTVIDNAITRTMSRTVITHLSTELAVLSVFFFGGEALHNFALALTIGILFGIYSSVLVASPLAMFLGVARENLLPVEKEGADAQSLP